MSFREEDSDSESVMTTSESLFTCLTCHIAFRQPDAQRKHYKSDWHRYNLKRKVALLPPVTQTVFVQRTTAASASADFTSPKRQTTANSLSQEDPNLPKRINKSSSLSNAQTSATTPVSASFECQACSKIYSSQNAYQNHLQSKKHKESSSSNPSSSNSNPLSAATIKAKSDSATASVVSSAQEREWRNKLAQVQSEEELAVLLAEKMATATRLTDTQCLFCTHTAESIDANMNHMCTAHSFFVPDIEYLADLRGLVAYLGEKVAVAHMCLFCNGKGRAFHSIESVRKHMNDKGHCKMLYDDEETADEYIQFYDFSSAYESAADGDDEEWEDLEEAGGNCENDVEEMVKEEDEAEEDVHQSAGPSLANAGKYRRPAPAESFLAESGTQLLLPSGRMAGARAYNMYWRQHLKPEESRDAILINQLRLTYTSMGLVSGSSRSIGGAVVAAARRQENVQRRVQAKMQVKAFQDHKSRIGMKANGLQKHFRHQNPL